MIPELTIDEPFTLDPCGSWPETQHVFDEDSVYAIRMALAAERPLLLRGDPGTGKSQLARAAAQKLGRIFISEVVHSRTEPQDLQWRMDAISRLGKAQMLGQSGTKYQDELPKDITDPLDPRLFLNPGVLWWVFGWQSAFTQHGYSCHKSYLPEAPPEWDASKGAVLLIDEIDKADADLPNSLLETLGNRAFHIPWLGETIRQQQGDALPLVIITTNEERELPAAFVRRCLVMEMNLPDKQDDVFVNWLYKRGRVHFKDPQTCPDSVLKDAAKLLIEDRKEAGRQGFKKPGQAEYLDLVKAVTTLEKTEKKQRDLLQKVSHFAFKKHRQ
ncbi:MAG: hypothetical protein BWK73_40515 [Thiothrix lacustris]|uniref:AAA+ ATPase domain-containing protein n=1 Tax=Thiothrix lacustris TaxID=525917 RepID=A0A1Y1QDC5_9GAMM|nr:MAG: hypothetical protein BWK73_40515 [Thiothrix lacustris]